LNHSHTSTHQVVSKVCGSGEIVSDTTQQQAHVFSSRTEKINGYFIGSIYKLFFQKYVRSESTG